MNPLGYLRRVSSAPVARQRLEGLLERERRIIGEADPIMMLREDILTVVRLRALPCKVRVDVRRGVILSRIAVDIEISN